MSIRWLPIVFLILLVTAPAFAEPHLRTDGDTVIFDDPETGERLWSFQHESLQPDDGAWSVSIPDPVKSNGRWLYAVGADVLEFDPSAKAIVARTHYSLFIQELRRSSEGTLEVVVTHEDPDSSEERESVFVHSGVSPGRGFWNGMTSFRAWRDVSKHFAEEEWEESEESPEIRAKFAPALLEAAPKDLTNPYYYGVLGLFAHLDGEASSADSFFTRAIDIPTTWFDTIRLCGILHRAERTELASQTCSKALELMKKRGIRPEAMNGLVSFVLVMGEHITAMEAAMEARDYDRIDAIAGDMHRLFPAVEGSRFAWDLLGGWLADEGKEKLAKKWHDRANTTHPSVSDNVFHTSGKLVDRLLLVSGTIVLTLPLIGLLVGFRTSRRRPDLEGHARWVPRLSLPESLSLTAVVLLAVFAGHGTAKEIQIVGKHASMPMTLLSEGDGSPDAIAWLENLAPGPAQEQLLAYGRHEFEAASRGVEITQEPPPLDAVLDAIEHDAATVVWGEFVTSGSFKIFERASATDDALEIPSSYPPIGIPILGIFLVLLVVGAIVSRLAPRFVRIAGYFIPGGTQNAGWSTPWIFGAFVGGTLWATTPLGTVLQSISVPPFAKYFGLSLIEVDYTARTGLDVWLPVVLIVASLSVHTVLVVLDWREARDPRSS